MFNNGVRRRFMLSAFAIALTSFGLVAAGSAPAYASPRDNVRITDAEIDFGGEVFAAGVPVGSGTLDWRESVPQPPVYAPELDGTLHINNADGKCGRMHMAVYTNYGGVGVQHSSAFCVYDNDHHHTHVTLESLGYSHITSATICTELSTSSLGPWDIMTCQTEYV